MSFLKFNLRNLFENKIRSILVIISVTASAALLFATLGLMVTTRDTTVNQAKQYVGSADLFLSPKDTAESDEFVSVTIPDTVKDKIDYQIGLVSSSGLFDPSEKDDDSLYVTALGTTLDDLAKYNPIVLKEKKQNMDFTGSEVIISSAFADQFNVRLGDKIKIQFTQKASELTVVGIAEKSGIFADENNGYYVLTPRKWMQNLFNAGDKCNQYMIKAVKAQDIDEVKNGYNNSYEDCEAKYAINQVSVNSAVTNTVLPYGISGLFVVIMSIFIVYTSFSLIYMERRPIIGTFRSIGATKRQLNCSNIVESIIIGLLGGALGCGLGVLVLRWILNQQASTVNGLKTETASYFGGMVVSTLIFSVILTLIGCIVPMFKMSHQSIKNIIIDKPDQTHGYSIKHSVVSLLICVLLFAALVIMLPTMPSNMISSLLQVIGMVGIIVITVIAAPHIIHLLSRLFGRIPMKSTSIWMAMRNVSSSSKLRNIIKMMIISISCVILISQLTSSVSVAVKYETGKSFNYDIMMKIRNADADTLKEVENVDGIKSTIGCYVLNNIYCKTTNHYFGAVYGVDDATLFDFVKTKLDSSQKQAVDNLDKGKNVIVSKLLASKIGLSVGDNLVMETKNGQVTYKITALVDNSLYSSNLCFISSENLKKDWNITAYTDIYARVDNTDNMEKTLRNVRKEFNANLFYIITTKKIIDDNYEYVMKVFGMLETYAYFAAILGILGIVNNIIASFMERKRELVMDRSIGMSHKQMMAMLFVESILCAIFGVLLAALAGYGMLVIAPSMMSFVLGTIQFSFDPIIIAYILLISVVAMCFISFIPIYKCSRLNIVESIKRD